MSRRLILSFVVFTLAEVLHYCATFTVCSLPALHTHDDIAAVMEMLYRNRTVGSNAVETADGEDSEVPSGENINTATTTPANAVTSVAPTWPPSTVVAATSTSTTEVVAATSRSTTEAAGNSKFTTEAATNSEFTTEVAGNSKFTTEMAPIAVPTEKSTTRIPLSTILPSTITMAPPSSPIMMLTVPPRRAIQQPTTTITTKQSMMHIPMYMKPRPPLSSPTPRPPPHSDPSRLPTPRPVPSPTPAQSHDKISFEILHYPFQQKMYNYYGSNYRFPVYGRYHGIWTEKEKPTPPPTVKPLHELPSPGFDRPCKTYFDCGFRPAKNMTRTWLKCEKEYCACEMLGYFKDEDIDWELKWSRKMEVCQADNGGPCGRNKGLEIHCKRGHRCIGSVCQRPGKPKTTTTTTPEPSSESCEDCSGDAARDGMKKDDKAANVFSLILFPGLNFFKNVLNDSLSAIKS